MKTKIGILVIAFLVALSYINAQDLTTVEATDEDISENLDLEAIEKDKYQDVATIDAEKDSKGETQVQAVGDVYMYVTAHIRIHTFVN